MNINYKKGIVLAFITAVISGFSIFYNKFAVIGGMDSTVFNIIKNGGVAIIFSGIIIFSKNRNRFKNLTKKDWIKLLLIGIIGGSIPFILFFEGLKLIPAASANILQKTLFIWIALLAIPILKEKLNFLQIIGYLLIIYANFFLGGFQGFSTSIGTWLILTATIFWAIENVIAKITLKNIDPLLVGWARMTFGVLVMILFALSQNKLGQFSLLTPAKVMPILISILFLTGYVLTWYKALKNAPATLVSSILVFATSITTILSSLFITHTFPNSGFVTAFLLLLGILVISIFSSKNITVSGRPISI
ncbi:hypothetical protein A3D77_04015 [Candidatus Gottesmanbacteria bacterium RIFCSPHIGHO2_02_FULL_39_11]|uniref:EamA domain-containing protein n=1 Tax=Candidatus Gottesmanbacteria bacterium RIFCSPHIGHO2_02_FULL_39_11 TaxID=1798382 RepID=A0A1F5ZK01_9BACT|nr:MAG: hypothetical protein A3D77_04015 [Candidatus Gottesmanbacteria bacterium RIFCSPHIGHO2_02_FULL_39_11]